MYEGLKKKKHREIDKKTDRLIEDLSLTNFSSLFESSFHIEDVKLGSRILFSCTEC